MFACGLSMDQKCCNYALTNLLFNLCKSMWIIDLLFILPNPYPEAPACLSTPKVLRTKERAPTPSPFVVFTFGLTIESPQGIRGCIKYTLSFLFYFFLFSFGRYLSLLILCESLIRSRNEIWVWVRPSGKKSITTIACKGMSLLS
jgi:hypothetical protein